jgi:hypothetical protein
MMMELLPDTKFLDQCAITLEVMLAQIGKQTLTLTNKLHQTTMG